MAAVKDTMDVWSEAALEYIRDQLRTNATVGLTVSDGARVIEIGDVAAALSTGAIRTHPDALPAIWIGPGDDTPRRMGGALVHRIRVDVVVLTQVNAARDHSDFADDQQRARKLAKRVYNEALHLIEGGQTAGHWADWEPAGVIQPMLIEMQGERENHALYGVRLPFAMTVDRIWISGA